MLETFNFTSDFEDLILACFADDPEKFFRFTPILSYKYFTGETSSIAAMCLIDYVKKYSRTPSWEMWGQLVDERLSLVKSADKQAGVNYISKLKQINTADSDAVYDRVKKFCRERATLNVMRQTLLDIQENKLPEEGFLHRFEEALKIGENLDDLGYILHADAESVVDKITSAQFGISTGYPQLDKIWRTGWAPGWLIVPLAPPKRYKSTFMLNLAKNIIGPSVGEDVLYYTCEISGELAIMRLLYSITGLGEISMFEAPEMFKEKIRQKMPEVAAANLIVKHFPIGTATILDLKNHAKIAVKQLGIKPKAIFIDYADTVRPSDYSQPQHIQQANIYKEAIAFGKEMGACVIMADRCTKDAVDKKVPNMKAFQGAFAKGGIVDVAIGLCATDAEYSADILRSFVFINRHGPAFQHFRGKVDPELATIDIGSEIPYNPDEEEEEEQERKFKRKKKPEGLPEELI